MENELVELDILGHSVKLKSQGDPAFIDEVVDIVDQKIKQTQEKTGQAGIAAHQVALLACLDLAEEYLKMKKRAQSFQEQVTTKSKRLKHLLEEEID